MSKFLSILSIIFGLLIIIGLSIWVGFPVEGFNRYPVCVVGVFVGLGLIILGAVYFMKRIDF